MNLQELVEEVKKVVFEIDNEEVDVKKIKCLMSILKKLIIRFRQRALLSTMTELNDMSYYLLAEFSVDKSSNLSQVLKYLLEIVIEVEKNEYIDFNVSPIIKKK